MGASKSFFKILHQVNFTRPLLSFHKFSPMTIFLKQAKKVPYSSISAARLQFGQPVYETHPHLLKPGEGILIKISQDSTHNHSNTRNNCSGIFKQKV